MKKKIFIITGMILCILAGIVIVPSVIRTRQAVKEFEKDLAKCDSLDAESNNSCYVLLKERQLFFNEQYQREIQQKQISNQVWRDIHDKGSSPIMINIFSR